LICFEDKITASPRDAIHEIHRVRKKIRRMSCRKHTLLSHQITSNKIHWKNTTNYKPITNNH